VALAQSSPEDPAVLRAQVTSKGGTTERAIRALEAGSAGATLVAAVKAAARRAEELGDASGKRSVTRTATTACSTRPALLLDTVFGIVTYAFLLRFVMQWLRAPFRNPLGRRSSRLTDWAAKPVRRVVPGFPRTRCVDARARVGCAASCGSSRWRSLSVPACYQAASSRCSRCSQWSSC
jgi:uncharacterized protein YggT (Ycf19 family)